MTHRTVTPRSDAVGPFRVFSDDRADIAAWDWSVGAVKHGVELIDGGESIAGLLECRGFDGLGLEFFGVGSDNGTLEASLFAAWPLWDLAGSGPRRVDGATVEWHYRRLGVATVTLSTITGSSGETIGGGYRYADTIAWASDNIDTHFGAMQHYDLYVGASTNARPATQFSAADGNAAIARLDVALLGIPYVRVVPHGTANVTAINALAYLYQRRGGL